MDRQNEEPAFNQAMRAHLAQLASNRQLLQSAVLNVVQRAPAEPYEHRVLTVLDANVWSEEAAATFGTALPRSSQVMRTADGVLRLDLSPPRLLFGQPGEPTLGFDLAAVGSLSGSSKLVVAPGLPDEQFPVHPGVVAYVVDSTLPVDAKQVLTDANARGVLDSEVLPMVEVGYLQTVMLLGTEMCTYTQMLTYETFEGTVKQVTTMPTVTRDVFFWFNDHEPDTEETAALTAAQDALRHFLNAAFDDTRAAS